MKLSQIAETAALAIALQGCAATIENTAIQNPGGPSQIITGEDEAKGELVRGVLNTQYKTLEALKASCNKQSEKAERKLVVGIRTEYELPNGFVLSVPSSRDVPPAEYHLYEAALKDPKKNTWTCIDAPNSSNSWQKIR